VRTRIGGHLRQRGGDAAGEVERRIAPLTHRVFDLRAKGPQEDHVADDVRPARVHEHGCGQNRRPDAMSADVAAQALMNGSHASSSAMKTATFMPMIAAVTTGKSAGQHVSSVSGITFRLADSSGPARAPAGSREQGSVFGDAN
jgi:hypothetical protein